MREVGSSGATALTAIPLRAIQRPYDLGVDSTVVAFASAVVGVVGTLGGVLITQARSDRQAALERDAQNRRAMISVDSDRDRERDARLFDHRREVLREVVATYNSLMTPPYLRDDLMDEEQYHALIRTFWATLTGLDLYFQPDAADAFKTLYAQMFDLFNVGAPTEPREEVVKASYDRFLAIARRDLGVS